MHKEIKRKLHSRFLHFTRERLLTLGHATQGGDVLEHLREGDWRLHQLHVGGLVDELADHASSGVEVTDDVTHVLLWGVNLHLRNDRTWGSVCGLNFQLVDRMWYVLYMQWKLQMWAPDTVSVVSALSGSSLETLLYSRSRSLPFRSYF